MIAVVGAPASFELEVGIVMGLLTYFHCDVISTI